MKASPKNNSPASVGKKTAAWIFAITGMVALIWSGKRGYEQYKAENPPPLQNVIAPIPADKVEAVRAGLKLVGPTVLGLAPDQQEQVDAIWRHPPRSIEEVIQYLDRTHAIMTPDQRARFKPLRKGFQERVIDQLMAPAAQGMSADDFAKLKAGVKRRVENRIERSTK